MALTCWLAGWAAAARIAWEPLAVAVAALALFAAAQSTRRALRLRTIEPASARSSLVIAAVLALAPLVLLVLMIVHLRDAAWIAAVAAPALLYAPFLLAKAERHPVARIIAVLAFSAIAPATHALASGRFDRISALLWGALAGYYLVGAVFIMARLRHSSRALWAARALAAVALVASFALHWLIAAAFAPLALRAWLFRPTPERIDARRVGKVELAFSTLAASLVLLSIWVR